MAQYFENQELDYLSRIPENLNFYNLEGYVTYNQPAYDALLHGLMVGLLFPSLMAGASAAQLQIKVSLAFGQVNPFVQDYLQTTALNHVKGINATTRDQLRVSLSEGLGKGEGLPELSQRVSKTFTEAKGYRASLIARNETAQAFSHANHQALAKTGVVNFRRWLTAPSDVCPICQPLNGYTIRFDAQFPDGAEPGFVHISCRCSEIGLIEGVAT